MSQLTQVRWSKTVQHAKRYDCHVEVDTFWRTQPIQCCNGVRDVVITTQSIHQIVFSGDVSSTRQHSIRGTPLKKTIAYHSCIIMSVKLFYPFVNKIELS